MDQNTQQTNTPEAHPQQPKSSAQKLQTTGAVISIIAGGFMTLIGIMTISANLILGTLLAGVGVFWIAYAYRLFSTAPSTSASLIIQRLATSAIATTGILFFLGMFMIGYKLSGAVFPLVFAITMSIISVKFSKYYPTKAPAGK